MIQLTFGDSQDVRAALKHFHQCHVHVHGESRELAGQRYDANNPQLKMWVLATVIDSVLRVYELLIAPLSYADKCAYYRDAARLGRWLGIPPEHIPATYTAFNLYFGAMLMGDTLRVTDTARRERRARMALQNAVE